MLRSKVYINKLTKTLVFLSFRPAFSTNRVLAQTPTTTITKLVRIGDPLASTI